MENTKYWLETVFKKKSHEDFPLKVLEFQIQDPGMGRGENYLSKIEFIRAQVLLGSGKVKTMSFIVKNMLETEAMRNFCQSNGVFIKEITVYRDIFPSMSCILEEVGDGEIFWPKCYDARLYDRLMFEDLGALGFRMADRKRQLGLEASSLVLRHLAKLHALSRILLDKGEIPTQIFVKPAWLDSQINSMEGTLKRLLSAMDNWGAEWEEAMDRLRMAKDFVRRYANSLREDPDDFVVLNHGDCWTNNILFVGDDLEHPVSLRFVDFQVSFIASPIRDISYFLSTSVRHEVLNCNLEFFLKNYAEALGSYLTKYGYQGTIPSHDVIRRELKKRDILLVADAIRVLPWQLTNKENVPNTEEINKKLNRLKEEGRETEENADITPNIYKHLDPTAEAILKNLLRRALENKII